jgi:hypothetical protein
MKLLYELGAGIGCSLLMVGCAIPGGASIPPVEYSTYQMKITGTELNFNFGTASSPQTLSGITASIEPQNNMPAMFYRYRVDSMINGKYVAMPAPPMIYTVYKIPFYKNDPDNAVVKLTLYNSTSDIVRTGEAVYVFNVGEQTLMSSPLKIDAVLPGQSVAVPVMGPSLEQLKSAAKTGTLDLWIYGINGSDKGHAFHWTIPYVIATEDTVATGETLGQTTSKDVANSYDGRVVPASPDNNTSEQLPGGTSQE